MKINLVSHDNGVGLTRDAAILREIFEDEGWAVTFTEHQCNPRAIEPHDLNIYLELFNPGLIPTAKANVMIPNPEWFMGYWTGHLPQIEIWAKTQSAIQPFKRHTQTRFIGFTSRDMYKPMPKRREFFHLAGKSDAKNTRLILNLWRRFPKWPHLTVLHHPGKSYPITSPNITKITDRLSDQDLRDLMNSHLFHLCPSKVEGYGHYIGEGLSTGAVVITTNGAPMNELVTAERGILVPNSGSAGIVNKSQTWKISEKSLEAAVRRCINMPMTEAVRLGDNAREWFEDNDDRFRVEIVKAVKRVVGVRA